MNTSGPEHRRLRRIDSHERLPAAFHHLDENEKRIVLKRILDHDVELRAELLKRMGKSQLAEHDLAVAIETLQQLDHEKKIYSYESKGETGSGTYGIKVRGGDTQFIVPILIVAGIVFVAIMLIFAR